jgi:plastocyanin
VRTRATWLVLLAALLAAPPAPAADQTVVATDKVFTPADVTVFQGDSVTWTNGGGSHTVHFDGNSFVAPAAPDATPWSVTRTFDTVGVFRYYCEAHGWPNGVDMSGAVTVRPAAEDKQPVSADKTAPVLTLSGSTRQKVLRQRAVHVRARVSEGSRVIARAWVSLPGTGKSRRAVSAGKNLAAGATAKLRPRFPRHTMRRFRRALRKHSRLTARITVTATDGAGNRTSLKRRVTLKR